MKNVILSFILLMTLACAQRQDLSSLSGVHDAAILGGHQVKADSELQSQLVYLFIQGANQSYGECTGVYISSQVVLTAAHCVASIANQPEKVRIATGVEMRPLEPDFHAQTVEVLKIKVHPDYIPRQTFKGSDVALLLVSTKNQKMHHSLPILYFWTENIINQEFEIAGFGKSVDYHVTEMGSPRLRQTIVKMATEVLNKPIKIGPDSTHLVFDQSLGQGACAGDSGGPATVVVDGQRYLVGLTSIAANFKDVNKACSGVSFYTNLLPLRPWIMTEALLISQN